MRVQLPTDSGNTAAQEEPEIAALYLLAGQLLVPQSLKPLEWAELDHGDVSALITLGCVSDTWDTGVYFLQDPSCLHQVCAWGRPCSAC